jgi:hypothetical protein
MARGRRRQTWGEDVRVDCGDLRARGRGAALQTAKWQRLRRSLLVIRLIQGMLLEFNNVWSPADQSGHLRCSHHLNSKLSQTL